MLETAFMALMSGEVTPETRRLSVYALAAICGLTVTAIITICKDIPKQAEWERQQQALARLAALTRRK